MHHTLLAFAIVTLLPFAGAAQPRTMRGEAGSQFLFYEVTPVPSSNDSNEARIDVHYRIDSEFFVPVKQTESSADQPFHRRGEILAEMLDSTGIVASRAMQSLDIPEPNADRRPMGSEWQQGILSVFVPYGTYRVQLTVDDLDSRRTFMDSSHVVRTAPRGATGLSTASIFLVAPPQTRDSIPSQISPMNYGGDILFGQPSALLIAWESTAAAETLLTVTVQFTVMPPSPEDQALIPPAQKVQVKAYRGIALEESPASADYDVLAAGKGRSPCLAFVPLPTARLLLRNYTMKVTLESGGSSREIERRPRTVWPDMPFSLKDIDYALEVLKYITTENELDSLRRGNMEVRKRNLEGFWRSKGEAYTSAYNEIMTEYYRRVDYAVRNFGTLRQPDGFHSDRGRIYILYGPPSSTDRTLDPKEGFQEIWIYERLKKRFVFVDQNKSGNYVLQSTTSL
ncbi:MAG TPA: GWxTD domain-containing protein [Bacteroidota bacterium]|nr:GWxTD domain-containing protein [Bacteroidota bacterium]